MKTRPHNGDIKWYITQALAAPVGSPYAFVLLNEPMWYVYGFVCCDAFNQSFVSWTWLRSAIGRDWHPSMFVPRRWPGRSCALMWVVKDASGRQKKGYGILWENVSGGARERDTWGWDAYCAPLNVFHPPISFKGIKRCENVLLS